MRRQNASQTPPQGPYRAEQLRSGDPYELSNGYRIACAPTGGRGSGPNGLGFLVTSSDPVVQEAGVDAGYSPEPGMLRAPDVAVGNVPDKPGWIKGAPALAIEYADLGQDEGELTEKISDLLGAGTRFLWVVRLTGPRRVEVHEPDKAMVTVLPGKHLVAPGVLKNPVLVEALYERGAAQRAALTNLLQRAGYADLEAVLAEGREEGLVALRASLRRVLARRKLALGAEDEAKIAACSDLETLARWLEEAVDAKSAAEALR
jgi:hypothetical protein